jgi:cell division septal protein FtsQ
MRDLNIKHTKPAINRLKKQRKPINYRWIFGKVLRIAGGIMVLSLVGVVAYQLYGILSRSTLLRLEKIEVNRLQRLTRDEIIALAGVRPGDDMFSLRLKCIGEQLGKNPWIEHVSIRRYFPRTLSIQLAEREPAAVVSMGYLYYLDKKGNVFKPIHEGDRLDFPVVTGITEDDMVKDPTGSREAFQQVLKLIAILEKGTVLRLQDISEIHYDRGFGYTLFTAPGGVPIRIGNGGYGAKLERLAKIYPEIKAQMTRMEYIDLDYQDKIIVKKG